MIKDFLVRIFVPTLGSKGKRGFTGTGYPVGRDLILTASHVVNPDKRDHAHRIEIMWYGDPEQKWRQLDPTKSVAWDGKLYGLDAALLRYSDPPAWIKQPIRPGTVSGQRPKGTIEFEWQSAGYAAAGKSEAGRELCSCFGRMAEVADRDKRCEIHVIGGRPEKDLDWRGASGMPIFRQGTHEIFAVAQAVPPKFDAAKLFATPTFQLRREPSFLEVLSDREPEHRRDRFGEALVDVLSQSTVACEALAATALLKGVNITGLDLTKTLVRHLLETPIREAIVALRDACDTIERFRKRRDTQELKDAEKVLRDAASFVIPALFDDGQVNVIRSQIQNHQVAICGPVCNSRTVAEIVLAAAQDRPAEFRPRKDKREWPMGVRQLPAPPEAGISDAERNLRESIQKTINAKLCLSKWPKFRIQIDDHIIQSLLHRDQIVEDKPAENKNLAEIVLADEARRGNSFYFFCMLPNEAIERSAMEEQLILLKKDFSSLIIMAQMDDINLARQEFADFIGLRSILA